MNEVTESQIEIINEFSFFEDWMDKYQYIIDLGRRLSPLAEQEKINDNKIKGCQSQVWLICESDNERLLFRAISDAAIVSGLIAILLRIYSNKKPQDILEAPIDFIEALQLEQHLSATRSNGLSSMLAAIKSHAVQSIEDHD
ncbi:MAG: SufE family protein [Woeseiaceae bacterium]|jgi:cysteine desulfuration protein SufE|nr:SufE family protein [Woeseiaceae bacterium]|tara:strand:+ start:290 stop:715 length:426 start_codon:yes stop_codon:yes gene_type:complete